MHSCRAGDEEVGRGDEARRVQVRVRLVHLDGGGGGGGDGSGGGDDRDDDDDDACLVCVTCTFSSLEETIINAMNYISDNGEVVGQTILR